MSAMSSSSIIPSAAVPPPSLRTRSSLPSSAGSLNRPWAPTALISPRDRLTTSPVSARSFSSNRSSMTFDHDDAHHRAMLRLRHSKYRLRQEDGERQKEKEAVKERLKQLEENRKRLKK
eukprot:GHVS01033918.1.p1 GENE.GHVS01033918.1~~GHVS01033918.1.p1  ORF type:complete len:119 (-),score=28.28 GHVS01033918.1:390-746(-)